MIKNKKILNKNPGKTVCFSTLFSLCRAKDINQDTLSSKSHSFHDGIITRHYSTFIKAKSSDEELPIKSSNSLFLLKNQYRMLITKLRIHKISENNIEKELAKKLTLKFRKTKSFLIIAYCFLDNFSIISELNKLGVWTLLITENQNNIEFERNPCLEIINDSIKTLQIYKNDCFLLDLRDKNPLEIINSGIFPSILNKSKSFIIIFCEKWDYSDLPLLFSDKVLSITIEQFETKENKNFFIVLIGEINLTTSLDECKYLLDCISNDYPYLKPNLYTLIENIIYNIGAKEIFRLINLTEETISLENNSFLECFLSICEGEGLINNIAEYIKTEELKGNKKLTAIHDKKDINKRK